MGIYRQKKLAAPR